MDKSVSGDASTANPAGRTASAFKVAAAAMVGSAIEAFDFIAYGTAVALVFDQVFFPSTDGVSGRMIAFAAMGTGFVARPLGGLIFGHYGDRIGRKAVLTFSLIMMGLSTLAIGLLPGYATLGVAAQIIIVLLRILQGISLGGELAGAMLMAVEHAPPGRRSLFGSMPQMGTPVGVLLCTGAFAVTSRMMSNETFLAWGWRVPFLVSVLLVAVGLVIRLKVDETPSFKSAKESRLTSPFPAREVVLRYWRPLALIIGAKVGEVALYSTLVTFMVSYGIANLGFDNADTLRAVMIGAGCQVVAIPLFGFLGDKVGTRRLFIVGAAISTLSSIPVFMALGSGSLLAFTLALAFGLAINYSIIFAAQTELYSAQFPVELRFSGVALGIQIAAAIGGGVAPLLAVTLSARYGSLLPLGLGFAALAALALFCAMVMKGADDVRI